MNEQVIFLAALDIADPAERVAYVKRTCANDATLLRQVESLLAAHLQSGEFLDVPALKQIAAGVADDRRSPDETSAEQHGAKGEVNLSFLQPSAKPGSLGRLGHYEVQEVIGRGGFGIVLKAFDEMLHRVVAIKVLAPELAATSPARKRFLREARAAAAIRHENVVSIYSVEEQPLPYLVMEYIAGQTLQQKLDQSGPLGVREVVQIGQQIATGLEAAHAMGLIHRDIKPGNILLENGVNRVKITDFGLARTSDDASLTQSGVIAGTPLYMSPEQAKGDVIDQRSDLFSLGSVLYVMCSGRPPFRAATTVAVLMRVVEDQPRPIQQIIPEVPEWLSAIIARLHAKKPSDRFASAHEVAGLLARCLSELQQHGKVESVEDVLPMTGKPASAGREPVEAERPTSEATPMPAADNRRPLARSRRWVAAAAVILVLLAGLGMTEATGVTNLRGTVIRLFLPDGTLVVEVDDPDVSVSIDGVEMVIAGAGVKEIRLRPGQYNVLASKDGKVVLQELVTVTRNGRQVVRVSKEAETVMVAGDRSTITDPDRRAAEWALSVGGTIKITLGNVRERPIEAATDLPPRFAFTTAYFYRNPTVTDVGLAQFKDCKNLTSLHLADTSATDAGLAYFKDCKNLKDLYLYGINISDAGLAHFKDYKNLTSLSIQNASVTDAGLAYFKDCKNLTSLILWNAPVSDSGLAYFKDSKSITTLDLCEIQVGDAGLAHFKDCNRVTHLDLHNTWVSDTGVAHFKDCKDLAFLNLGSTHVSDLGLVHFKDCKNITALSIGAAQVGNAGLAYFKDCKNLTVLYLNNAQVSDAGLVHVKGWKNLKHLDLRGTQVSDAGLAHFMDCNELTSLILWNTQVSDSGLAHLKDCKNLTGLDLRNTNVTTAGIDALTKALPRCKIEWDDGVIEPMPAVVATTELSDDTEEVRIEKGGKPAAVVKATDSPKSSPPERAETAPAAGPTAEPTVRPADVAGTNIDRRVAEQVLALGGTMYLLYRSSPRIVSTINDLPDDSFKITSIDLTNAQLLRGEHVAMIGQLRHLRSLNVEGKPLVNDDLREIGKLQTLRSLDINHTKVNEEGVENLAPLERLTSLKVAGITLKARGMRAIGKLSRLEELYLDGTDVNDEGLSQLQGLKRLRLLRLARARISDAGLKSLAGLTDLEDLSVYETRINGSGLSHLAGLPRLDTLTLGATRITDEYVKALQAFPALHEVDLRHTQLTDQAVEALSQVKTMTEINLDGTRVTDAGREKLDAALPASHLNRDHIAANRAAAVWVLENGGSVGGAFGEVKRVGDLPAGPFEISAINIAKQPAVDDAGARHLAQLSNLRSLNISGTNITSQGLRRIGALPRLGGFGANISVITDDGVGAFVGHRTADLLQVFLRK